MTARKTEIEAPQSRDDLRVVYRDPRELEPYGRNARTHSPEQIEQIQASIAEFGFTNPVLLKDDERTIGAGHARTLAALALGLDRVPTITLLGLTETQWRAYVIADNKLALNAGWDNELLKLEFGELGSLGFDLTLTGFSLEAIGELTPTPAAAPEDFKAFGDDLETEHECPRCKYRWSGSSSPAESS